MSFLLNGKAVTEEEWRASGSRLNEFFGKVVTPPTVITDVSLWRGMGNGAQFEKTPHFGDFYANQARKAGVNTKGKIYKSGLARFPGDPEAWVETRGDIVRLCEKRNLDCDGIVKVKAKSLDKPPEQVDLAPDIVERLVDKHIATSIERPVKESRQTLREKIKDKHAPKWGKKK